MKPNKEKTGFENIIDLIKNSNPDFDALPTQVELSAIGTDEVTGKTRLTLTAITDAGFSGTVDVKYDRQELSVKVGEEAYFESETSLTAAQIQQLIVDHFDLIPTEVEWAGLDALDLETDQIVGVRLTVSNNPIYKDTAGVDIYFTSVDLSEGIRGNHLGIRVDSNGRVRGTNIPLSENGPGPGAVLRSTVGSTGKAIDIYGEVVGEQPLFTAEELVAAFDITQGNPVDIGQPLRWFKVAYEGKVLFIPTQALRSHISWQHLYERGLVNGDDTTGTPGTLPPVVQNAVFDKGGYRYRVRLFKGLVGSEGTNTIGYHTSHASLTNGSEWNDLMYRLSAANPLGVTDNIALLTNKELGVYYTGNTADNAEPGSYTWCQETSTRQTNARILRGWDGVGYMSSYTYSNTQVWMGWRPVLELVGPTPQPELPTELMYGDSTDGYYGMVDAANFVSDADIISAVSLVSAPTILNADSSWYKFSIDNEDVYVRSKPIANDVSYRELYEAGAMARGVSTVPGVGSYEQDTEIAFGGRRYLLTTLPLFTTPNSWVVGDYLNNGGLWGRTLGRLLPVALEGNNMYPHVEAQGEYGTSANGELFATYGSNGTTHNAWGTIDATIGSARHVPLNEDHGWRPVLIDLGPV